MTGLTMPELPEVETIKSDLADSVVGATIVGFSTNSSKQIFPSEKIVKESIVGSKIVGVERRGKIIVISVKYLVGSIKYLLIHLKMSGRVFLRRKNEPADKYTRAIFELSIPHIVISSPTEWGEKSISGVNDLKHVNRLPRPASSRNAGLRGTRNDRVMELRFCDTRKFGFVKLLNGKIEKERYFRKYGPEPFSSSFSTKYLIDKLKNCKRSIKSIIMDQEVVVGVGNIYANEALYSAGIRSNKPGGLLTKREIVKLLNCIKTVLKKGIKYRGSSSRDESYKDLYGELGLYQKHFLVYEKKGKPCKKCGNMIEYMRVGGRGTFFCRKCQK